MNYEEVIQKLIFLSNPKAARLMVKYGINPDNNLGISVANIKKIAKEIGKDHNLALMLWSPKIHDAQMLAPLIDDQKQVTEEQMEKWVKEFNSWDVCDNCCGHLFDKTKYGYQKAVEWSARKEEFVKRASFVLMVCYAVHDKKAEDEKFISFFEFIKKEVTDERNYVKKAVCWALRQIGKRNVNLNKKAIETAKEIQKINSKSAKWISSKAIKELTNKKIRNRACKKIKKNDNNF